MITESFLFFSITYNETDDIENLPIRQIPTYYYPAAVMHLVLTLMYLLVLVVIKKQVSTSSFYYIFFIIGVFYLTSWYSYEIVDALWYIDNYKTFNIKHIFYVSHFVTYFAVLLLNVVSVLNRFSSTFVSYNYIWKRSYINGYIILTILVGLFATFYDLDLSNDYTFNVNGWDIKYPASRSTNFRGRIIVIKLFTDVIFIIFTYGTHLRIKKLQVSDQKSQKTILKLLIFHIPIQIVFYVYQIRVILKTRESWHAALISQIAFLEYVGNAISILLINKGVRTEFLQLVTLRRFWKTTTVSMITTTTTKF